MAGDAVDDLIELLERAKPVPLTDQARINRRKAAGLVEEIERVAPGNTALVEAARRVAAAAEDARPVPLTSDVRLPAELLGDLAAGLRAAPR